MFKKIDVINRSYEIKRAKKLNVSKEEITEESGWLCQELQDDPDVQSAINNVLLRCLQSKVKKV